MKLQKQQKLSRKWLKSLHFMLHYDSFSKKCSISPGLTLINILVSESNKKSVLQLFITNQASITQFQSIHLVYLQLCISEKYKGHNFSETHHLFSALLTWRVKPSFIPDRK